MESKYYKEHFWGVSQIQAVYQEREAQIGVNTSNGFFYTEDPALLFEGSRTHEVYFTTGEDIQTTSCIVATRNNDANGQNVFLYVSNGCIRALVGGSPVGQGAVIQPTTTYHVVLSVDTNNTKADMYVNGGIAASISSFSDYQNPNVYLVGALNYSTGSYPFKGVIHYHRLFNYALSAYDAALLWNNGNLMAGSWPIMQNIPFPGDRYTESSMTFFPNDPNVSTSSQFDVAQANGFSGKFMRFDAITTLSIYTSTPMIISPVVTNRVRYNIEYRGFGPFFYGTDPTPGNTVDTALPDNTGDAKKYAMVFDATKINHVITGSNDSPDSWLEMRILSIESVGCVGEYLSKNLTETAWINSAQQLAYNDSYQEPLLDNTESSNLVAMGTPNILYNEEVWYGIEWHISASDPHCTRIGNLELHKTLPIQNKMRGVCS